MQYDFKVTIVGARLARSTVQASQANYKYQLRWKRGDKLSGKTVALPPAEDGTVLWNYQAGFASTIQRKDPTRLHKKLMSLILTEYRPREDAGKYDKKTWEGAFNLAVAVGNKLGDPLDGSSHTVICGKDSGNLVEITVSGVPRGDSDQDLMTDAPPLTDAGGLASNDVDAPTELSLDLEDDDALLSLSESGKSPSAVPTPPPRTQAPPGTPGVPMSEHLKLAEELKQMKEELKAAKKRQTDPTELAALKAGLAASEAKRGQIEAHLTATQRASTQHARELTLLLHGVILPPANLSPRDAAATIMKAILKWDALSSTHNPSGEANSFVVNTVSALECAVVSVASTDVSGAARWGSVLWHLLRYLAAAFPTVLELNEAVGSFSGDSFAVHVFATLCVEPLLTQEARPPPLVMSSADIPVIAVGVEAEPAEVGTILSFAAHVMCSMQTVLNVLLGERVALIERHVADVIEGRPGAVGTILELVGSVHTPLLLADADEGLIAAVARHLFGSVDRLLFQSLVRSAANCTDERALRYKEMCSKFEKWMRDAKLLQGPSGSLCRTALSSVRQTCDFLLLRGGTIVDETLLSAIPTAHLHTLLKNVEQATGETVPPETLQRALTLAKEKSGGGGSDVAHWSTQCPTALPVLTPTEEQAWASRVLPSALRPPNFVDLEI